MQEHPPQDSGGYWRRLKKKEDSKGFTLVELIVVIVILAILAAILIPGLLKWIDQAKDKKYELEAREIVLAAEAAKAKAYADGSVSCHCDDAGGIVYWYLLSDFSNGYYNWMRMEPLKQEIEKLANVDVKDIRSYAAEQVYDDMDLSMELALSAKNYEIYFVSSDNTKIYARYIIDAAYLTPTDGWKIEKRDGGWPFE